MHHEDIKCELRKRKSSLARLSRELGIDPSTVTMVSQRRHKSSRVEHAIALFLEKPVWEVFPDRYSAPASDAVRALEVV